MTRIFISYNHQQGKWVWERLAPCLKAGGAEVLIDRERFEVGKAVIGQMDALQDQADKHVLVLSLDFGQIWLFPQQPYKHQVFEEIMTSAPTLVYLDN